MIRSFLLKNFIFAAFGITCGPTVVECR